MASSPQGAGPSLNVDRSTVSASAFVREELSPQEEAGGYMSDDAATRALRTGTRKINKTLRQLNPFKVPFAAGLFATSGWDVEWTMLQGRLAGPIPRTKTVSCFDASQQRVPAPDGRWFNPEEFTAQKVRTPMG